MNKILISLLGIAILVSACTSTASPTLAPAGPAVDYGSQPSQAASTTVPTAAAQVPVTGSNPSATVPAATKAAATSKDLCVNPYYPVVDGAVWNYAYATGEKETQTIKVTGDGTFTRHSQGDKVDTTVDGSCTSAGIALLNTGALSLSFAGDPGSPTLAATQADGVTLPNNVQVGDKWLQSVNAAGSTGGSAATLASVENSYEALGFEDVTVPAGTFHALKVAQDSKVTMAGMPIETQLFVWYAEGVGVVKSEMPDIFSTELVSYTIP